MSTGLAPAKRARTLMNHLTAASVVRQCVRNRRHLAHGVVVGSSRSRLFSTTHSLGPPDPKELKQLIMRCIDDLSGAVGTQMIYIGDRLKLFSTLAEAGPQGLTAGALAELVRCHPRYVQTWADACVAQSYIESAAGAASAADPDAAAAQRTYWMTAAQHEVFSHEGGQFFQCGAAQFVSASARAWWSQRSVFRHGQ